MEQSVGVNEEGRDHMVFQLASPLLDACVMAILDQGDAYGYLLTQQIRQIVDISESTLYPVLRRLDKEQLLVTYDQPFQGRNRRYYRLTDEGKEKLTFYRQEWTEYMERISSILVPEPEEMKADAEDAVITEVEAGEEFPVDAVGADKEIKVGTETKAAKEMKAGFVEAKSEEKVSAEIVETTETTEIMDTLSEKSPEDVLEGGE